MSSEEPVDAMNALNLTPIEEESTNSSYFSAITTPATPLKEIEELKITSSPRTSTIIEKTDLADLSEISTVELGVNHGLDQSCPLSPIAKKLDDSFDMEKLNQNLHDSIVNAHLRNAVKVVPEIIESKFPLCMTRTLQVVNSLGMLRNNSTCVFVLDYEDGISKQI